MLHGSPRRAAAAVAAPLLLLLLLWPLRAQEPGTEVRALWVVRTTLTSPAAIAAMVSAAKGGGFNTLLVQVRGRGDAYFQNGLEPRPPALGAQTGFDPLATTIARAHDAGLRVHAWVNVNLVASANELPAALAHVVYRHPEWLMIPRALAEELAGVDPRSPGYLGRLARYVRGQPNELEGLYLSPVSPRSAAYTTSVVRDIVERYDVDGLHLDYIRYPRDDFDYGRDTLTAFRASVATDLTAVDRRTYDRRAAGKEPLVYTEAFPERWRAFRTQRLTALLTSLGRTAKAIRPSALVSVAVVPDPQEAVARRLQDWRGWLRGGLVDVVCPMAYTTDSALFAAQIGVAREIAGVHGLWAGIGAYRLSSPQIVEHVRTARRLGVGGVILFSYDSLADPARGPNYLSQVGRAAFLTGTY